MDFNLIENIRVRVIITVISIGFRKKVIITRDAIGHIPLCGAFQWGNSYFLTFVSNAKIIKIFYNQCCLQTDERIRKRQIFAKVLWLLKM